jgi:hypothetical protein
VTAGLIPHQTAGILDGSRFCTPLRRCFAAAALAIVCVFAGGMLASAPALAAAPEAPKTEPVTEISATTAMFHGILNPNAAAMSEAGKYEFLYQASNAECKAGATAPEPPGTALGFEHEEVPAQEVTGLSPHTEYTVCLLARNLTGEETAGSAVTFTTAQPPEAPEQLEANPIASSSATLRGALNPHNQGDPGSYKFVYRQSGSECQGEGQTTTPVTPSGGGTNEAASAAITGLLPHAQYTFCLLASNEAGEEAVAGPVTFTTPAAAPTIEEQFTTEVAATSVTLNAKLNPEGAATSYVFEYGPSGGAFALVSEPGGSASIVEGTSGVPVSVHMQHGLAPNTSYQFRVVARNAVETVTGEPVSFTTQALGGTLALPDGRAWEMVSPAQKHGAGIFELKNPVSAIQAAADGGAITYLTNLPTEANPQGYNLREQVLSTRSPVSWQSQDISNPHAEPAGIPESPEYQLFSSDLSHGVLQPFGNFEPALSVEASEQTAFLRTNYLNGDVNNHCASSCYRPLVTGKPGYANVPPGTEFGKYHTEAEFPCNPLQKCGPQFVGATSDLSHVVLQSEVPLTSAPAEPPTFSNWYLSEWSAGKLAPVGVLPDGEQSTNAQLGGYLGRYIRHAISADGSRVVWFQRTTANEGGLYLRDTVKGETMTIARRTAPEASFHPADPKFQIASNDGSRIFFSGEERLTPNSGARLSEEPDLYECDLVEVGGKLQCQLTDLTPVTSSGESANVRGQVLGASEDGSYVYFVADGVLAPGATPGTCHDQAPGSSTCNLYVSHDGTTKLVAVLSQADSPSWGQDGKLQTLSARVSPDGRWLAFMSQGKLTGYDNRDAVTGRPDQEVYLYDASSARLVCASCNSTGARPLGIPPGANGLAAEEGLWSGEALAAHIPTWEGLGELDNDAEGHSVYQPRFLAASGRLFFDSYDALVPQDVNGAWDVYEYEPPGVGGCAVSSATFSQRSGGCVGLVSSGTSAEPSVFLDASENGADVFFLTASRLSGQDTDTAPDIYDAHECTSESPCLATAVTQPPACTTEASCKPSPSPQPGVFGPPASATFSGPGNAAGSSPPDVPKKTVKCPKGKKLRHGKCVKAKPKRKKKMHKAKRANHHRRASR